MNAKRIFRDVFVLAAFCGVFFLLVRTVNFVSAGPPAVVDSEYSQDRANADYFYAKGNYRDSAKYYGNLAVIDPDNSHAWYNMGVSYDKVRYSYVKATREKRWSSDVPEWKRLAVKYADKAIDPFKECIAFQRYRNNARVRLAQIFVMKEEPDTAIKYLREALADGFHTKEGISNNWELATLKTQPDFSDLVVQERQNRNRRYNPENTGVRSRVGN